MGIKRIGKHILKGRWHVQRAFSRQALANIEKAIKASETSHAGQIRFVVESALDSASLLKDQPARDHAIDVFSRLRMWDTEHSNGILIYLLLADRDVEIVADRGINEKVQQSEWEQICRLMEADFRVGNFEGGVLKGIAATTRILAKHFPASGAQKNELPDEPVVI